MPQTRLPRALAMGIGIGIDENSTARDPLQRHRGQRRHQRRRQIWGCAASGLLGVFLLQIATYCAINEGHRGLLIRHYNYDCGSGCDSNSVSVSVNEKERPRFSTSSILSSLSWKKTMFSFLRYDKNDDDELALQDALETRRIQMRNNAGGSDNVFNLFPDTKSMLIVGGSDGSGTRAVVEVLRGLGTMVVSDDPETFDVHAAEIVNSLSGRTSTGWPSLIERFFSNFGREGVFPSVAESSSNNSNSKRASANYHWPPPSEQLEHEIQKDIANGIQADVDRLIGHWNDKYASMIKFVPIISDPTSQRSHVRASARDVTYAIKAPSSMLVLPLFTSMQQQHLEPQRKRPLKFLHVVRDGRDVAMSDNQSPVMKFYNLTYPPIHPRRDSLASFISSTTIESSNNTNNTNRSSNDHRPTTPDDASIMHAKAIQLWNDWNLNVYRWANDPKHSGRDVEYMWVRSEDLLIAGSQERLDALTALARFVGSTMTQDELCATSLRDTRDYGQSTSTNTKSHAKTKILHRGGGNEDIIAKWALQNRDTEKRKQQEELLLQQHQQQQRPWRRLTEDKQGNVFAEEYSSWKIVVDATLAKNPKEEVRLLLFDSLIHKGEELLVEQRLPISIQRSDSESILVELKRRIKDLKFRYRERRKLTHDKLVAAQTKENINIQSTGADKSSLNTIQNRYGKWKTLLEDKTSLREFFYKEGEEGLNLFGYHPHRQTRYTDVDLSTTSCGISTDLSNEQIKDQ